MAPTGVVQPRSSLSSVRGDTIAADSPSVIEAGSRGALIGAVAGVVSGVVAATVLTSRPGVSDREDTGLAFIVFSAFGALAGLVADTIVGVLTR
jgi:hypothetical protein